MGGPAPVVNSINCCRHSAGCRRRRVSRGMGLRRERHRNHWVELPRRLPPRSPILFLWIGAPAGEGDTFNLLAGPVSARQRYSNFLVAV